MRRRNAWGRQLACLLLLLALGGPAAFAAETEAVPEEAEIVELSLGSSGGGSLQPEYLECSDGSRIHCRYFQDGILGSDQELIRGCQNGAISMYMGVTSGAAEAVPEVALLDIPYLAETLEEYSEMYESTIVDWLQPYFHRKNLHLLTLSVVAFRGIYSAEPVKTPRDLEELRLRIMENPCHEAYWNALGVRTFTISFDQLDYAFRQNRINSAEMPSNSAGMLADASVFPYYIATNHLPSLRTQIMNLDAYESLTDAQRECLEEHYRNVGIIPETPSEETGREIQELQPEGELLDCLKKGQESVIQQLKLELGEEIVDAFLQQFTP